MKFNNPFKAKERKIEDLEVEEGGKVLWENFTYTWVED